MQPELPRTGLNGSALVELLAELGLAGPQASPNPAPPSFVEGLGRWLGWKDAITLSATLQALPPAAAGGALHGASCATALAALDAEFTRVRSALALAIAQTLADTEGSDFLPWRRSHSSLQQALEAAATALRTQARAVLQRLGTQHPGLATLAALDAALATALAPREQAQLALMPVLLEKHHRRHTAPEATPAAFRHDMQRLLQAELELRLQPALGLLDALRATHTGSP